MTSPSTQSETTLAGAIRIDGRQFYDIVGRLCELSEFHLSRSEYYGRSFQALSEYLGATVGMLNLRLGPRTLERMYSVDETIANQWLETIDSLALQSQSEATPLTRVYRDRDGEIIAYAFAVPIMSTSNNSIGAVAFVINSAETDNIESQLVQTSHLLELMVENAPLDQRKSNTPSTAPNASLVATQTLQSVVRAADYRSITHLSFAIVNSLCSKFGCEQVGIGLVRNRNVKLIAVSGLSEVPKSTPGMMAIQQAMAACLDRSEVSVVQPEGRLIGQIESSPCKLHHFWHRMAGESCVATLPLRIGDEVIAVVSLRRKPNQPWMPEDLRRATMLAESFAPALPLVDRASRSVLRHCIDSTVSLTSDLYTWNKIGSKIVALCLCATMLWAMFGTMEYRVMAPGKIVPEQIYTVSTPHEGRIEQVFVKPGQQVQAGELLVQLDTKDLLTEQMRIKTAITSTRIEANALLSQRRHQEAFLLQAEIEVLETDLNLIQEQLRRSQICAVHSGVVLPTTIHQRIGQRVPLGEPLLEIAHEDHWHLEIEVPDNEAMFVSQWQAGEFQSSARPDQHLSCKVRRISPTSQVLNNKNVVVAEAVLLEKQDWMKIGMEGYVSIDTGTKPVWWVYLHPVIDYVRLKLWL